MKRFVPLVLAALGLVAPACSSSQPTGSAGSATTAASQTEPTTTESGVGTTTTTEADDTTTPVPSVSDDSPPAIPLLGEVLDTSAGWPVPVILWDKDGARKQGHLAGPAMQVIDGPLAAIAEVPLQGWVYQREQESNVVYFSDGISAERELLVGTAEQSLILEGIWLHDSDGESAEVIYQRYDPAGQNSIQTLRAYSMATGEVREITVTGGFESSTSFSLINFRFVASRFSGEGHYELTLIDLQTGDRPYRSSDDDFDCFDGDPECPEYDQAIAIGSDIFGFGAVRNQSTGIVDQMGIYRFDTTTGTEEVVASYPWHNGAYYGIDMVQLNNVIAVSLAADPFSQGLGEPLPALLYDIGTGESTLAPEPGFVQLSWLS